MDHNFKTIMLPSDLVRRISHKNERSTSYTLRKGMEKFKKTALTHIADNLTNAEIKDLKNCFEKLDHNKDGILSMEELDRALSSGTQGSLNLSFIHELRERLDITASRTLKLKDFLKEAINRSIAVQEDKIQIAFDYFKRIDAGSDARYIEISDLIKVFGSEAQAKEVMGFVDLDRDGRIDYDEFKKMMEDKKISSP